MTHPLLDRDSVVCEPVSQHGDVQFPESHNTLDEVSAKREKKQFLTSVFFQQLT